ncbi:transcription termination factor 5, mitochondrial [Anopheles ziemanni]|uniref:transcription termination factor 5, mitochondrial n=1 Tax=Anopheles coustani TaxID=139045 RepID=UPI002658E1BD|nr:transcription termination factor 5, mitochondrial [Anopheles coustani]XP_058172882.1 transcription termination factor 5, mitochondrial [Anopheles ziemanni]
MFGLRVFFRTMCKESTKENMSVLEAIRFFAPRLEADHLKVQRWLTKNPALLQLDKTELDKKLTYLKYVYISPEEIFEHPNILCNHLVTLENRTTILRECGLVESLNLTALVNYIRLIRKNIDLLKRHRLIPQDLNMYEQFQRQFECTVEPKVRWDEQTLLQDLRIAFFNAFLAKRLDMTETELAKLWKSYSKIKHKSFGHTQRVVDILQYEYKFSREKLIANLYLLHSDPENLLRLPAEVPAIGGLTMREVAMKHPKVLMVNYESVVKVMAILKELNIPEGELLKCMTVLTLSPLTVADRLERLKNVKEFEVLTKHPRVLKLIQYQTKATIRLEYLQQLKVRCASLDVLSSHSQNFERYVREGCDRTKGRDTAHFLKYIFGDRADAALQKIRRHPNWFHVPIAQMQDTFEALLKLKYSREDILDNVHILLYPLNRIEEKLSALIDDRKVQDELGVEIYRASKMQLLALALYLIELEFHFTGDGVWPEQQIQQSDSGSSITIELPNSLSTEYKFGKKPAIAPGSS